MNGTTLGSYRIESELGRGGMGIVYKAHDTKLERTVALKVLPAAALASQDDRARFYREAKAAAALNHPNIAAIHQIDEAIAVDSDGNQVEASDGPRPFIAMEFVEGGTLEDRIKQGPLKLDEAVRIATQTAEALKAAHAKEIVHRDIKSANIMLTAEGQAKVLDFGLAQTSASTKLTRMGSTLGTVAYMSPEQARGEEVDGRSDLYSLGTVLYEMIAGRLPFGGEYEQAVVYSILNADPEPLTALRTGVPMELERITNKLLAKDAGRRYQTAQDLIADLEGLSDQVRTRSGQTTVLSGVHSGVYATPSFDRAPTPASSTPKPWMLAVAAVVLIALGWGVASLSGPDAAPLKVEKLQVRMEGMRLIKSVGISPNEEYFALIGYDWEGNQGLFLYDVSEGMINYVERTKGASYPWFSPKGDRLAFTNSDDNSMYVVEVPSGTPQKVVSGTWTSYWVDEDRLFYVREATGQANANENRGWSRGSNNIYSLQDDSSYVVRGTERDMSVQNAQWFFPGPRMTGSDYMLGNIQGGASFGIDPKLYLVDISDAALIATEHSGINPQPLTEEILIYQMGDDAGPIVARRFDPDRAAFSSPTEVILEGTFFAAFQTNPGTGSLLYLDQGLANRQVVSFLNFNQEEVASFQIPNQSGELYTIVLSDDESTLLLAILDGETGLNTIISVDMSSQDRRTPLVDQTISPVALTAEGDLYAFQYRLQQGAISEDRVLIRTSLLNPTNKDTLSKSIPMRTFGGRSQRGFVVGTDTHIGIINEETLEFEPLSESGLSRPDVSPDGRYVVFNLPTETHAVYDLQTDDIITVSEIDGGWATWSPDDRSILYISLADVPPGTADEGDVMRLPVQLGSSFRITGTAEFVAHVSYPASLEASSDGIIMHSLGPLTTSRPTKEYPYVVWWRHIGQQLEATLPK